MVLHRSNDSATVQLVLALENDSVAAVKMEMSVSIDVEDGESGLDTTVARSEASFASK